jgi:hypothetical protein
VAAWVAGTIGVVGYAVLGPSAGDPPPSVSPSASPTEEPEIVPCPSQEPTLADRRQAEPYLRIADAFNREWEGMAFAAPSPEVGDATNAESPSLVAGPTAASPDPSPMVAELRSLANALMTARAGVESLPLTGGAIARDRLRSELGGAARVVQRIADSGQVLDLVFLVRITLTRDDGSGPRAAATCLRDRLGLPPPERDEVL